MGEARGDGGGTKGGCSPDSAVHTSVHVDYKVFTLHLQLSPRGQWREGSEAGAQVPDIREGG